MSASREKRERKVQVTPSSKSKKKKQDDSVITRILAIVVSTLVVAAVVWLVINATGLPERTVPALTVGAHNVTPAEYDVYYAMAYNNMVQMYQSYGLDASQVSEESVKGTVDSQIQDTVCMADEARKNGVKLTEENQKYISDTLSDLKLSAKGQKISATKLLEANYGVGVRLSTLEKCLTDSLLSGQWAEEKRKSFTFTQDEIDKYYAEHKNEVDLVDYRIYTISSDLGDKEEPTDEDKAAAKAVAKQKADELLASITDEASFNTQAAAIAPADTAAAYQKDPNATLRTSTALSSLADAQKTWMSAADRKVGDKAVLENASDGYDVVFFLKRQRADYHNVSVRHILATFKDDEGNDVSTDPTDAQKETAQKKAQDILDRWKAGASTEDSFVELVKESDDTASVSTGGLYENVTFGQYVKPFEAWAMDPARKSGDTSIVETDYGYHVMYFSATNDDPAWVDTVRSTLVSAAYDEYHKALLDANAVAQVESGMAMTLKRRELTYAES